MDLKPRIKTPRSFDVKRYNYYAGFIFCQARTPYVLWTKQKRVDQAECASPYLLLDVINITPIASFR